MKTFTAIDFETANNSRTSACQIGVVVVENGEIVKEYVSFIKPVPAFMQAGFTDIHGITMSMLRNAPTFDKVWDEISPLILNAPKLVAHNAPFDKGVLIACLYYYSIDVDLPDFFCTCTASRRKLKELRNHKLSTVCRHFDIPLNHHEALSDARGAALIALQLGN